MANRVRDSFVGGSVLALCIGAGLTVLSGTALAQQTPAPSGLRLAQATSTGGQTSSRPILRPGQPVSSTLTSSDRLTGNGRYVRVYELDGQAGQTFTIRLESAAMDSFLVVAGPNNFSQHNDNAAQGTLDSVVELTLPQTGTYQVAVSSTAAGQTGTFRLTATPGRGSAARPSPPASPPAASQPTASTGQTVTLPVLRLGQPVSGTLSATDDRLDNGSYARFYEINAQAGQTYTIRMESAAMDSLLMVINSNDFNLINNNASQGTLDSMLELSVPPIRSVLCCGQYRSGRTDRTIPSDNDPRHRHSRQRHCRTTVTPDRSPDHPAGAGDQRHTDIVRPEAG